MANSKKITQAEFNQLYLHSLDDPVYRPLVDGKRHFRLAQLLKDFDFALDLSGLNLRNLNFRYADFEGVCLDDVDLGGSICTHADFTGVSCLSVRADGNTKFYGAKLTDAQLLQLQADPAMSSVRAVQKTEVDLLEADDEP